MVNQDEKPNFTKPSGVTDAATKGHNPPKKNTQEELHWLLHQYGFPNFITTFTPKGINTHLLRVYAGVNIGDISYFNKVSIEDIANHYRCIHKLHVNDTGPSSNMSKVRLGHVMEELLILDQPPLQPSRNDSQHGKLKATFVSTGHEANNMRHAQILHWVE